MGPTLPSSTPRIACIVVSNFTLAALCRAEPTLREIPLALTDGTGPRATITAVSEEAARHGVRVGFTAAQGAATCSSLVFRMIPRPDSRPVTWMDSQTEPIQDTRGSSHTNPPSVPSAASRIVSVDYRRAAQAALCEVATSCSPRVEDASNGNNRGYGIVYLDAQRAPFPSEHALGAALTARAESIGLDVRVGIASTKMTARLVAHQSPRVTVVPPNAERRFLAPLPIVLLEPDRELAAALARWGITHLGQLACLSPGAMGTRFGPAGATLVRRARGEDPTPLVPTPERSSFEEELVLDYGIDTLDPLSFVLRGCLDRLSARLALRGLACSGLHFSLGLATRVCEERTVAVAAPTTDTKVLLILTRLHLEATPPAAPVEAIRVVAVPAHMRAAQLDLFRPAGPAPEHLATTLARLATICGPGRVGAPVVVDSHRPETIALAPFDPPDGPDAPSFLSQNSPRSIAPLSDPPRLAPGLVRHVEPSESSEDSARWSLATATSSPANPAPRRPGGSHPVSGPPTSAAAPPSYRDGLCRLALRAVRPPRAVEVFDNRGQPDFVRGDRLGGRVVELAGPWRLTGEWWTEERFARDYYDVSLSDGGVYRMYRDLRTAQWFVEGEYD